MIEFMPKAKLIINGGESEVSIDEGVTSIGRVADNTISLAGDSNVSRYHVEIETRGKDFWLIELGSSNGTTVNGGRVYDEKLLKDGDVIVLGGSSEILFEQEKDTPAAEKTADSNAPSPAGSDVSAAASNVQTPSVLPTAAAPESEIAADTAKASKLPLMLAVTGIVCDTGEHYLTKFHSDEWMKEKLLLEPQKITAGLIAGTKAQTSPRELVFVSPTETVSDALNRMNENGVTQIPVLDEHASVGSLRESRVLAKLLADGDLINKPVSEVMDESFPVVDVDASLDQIKPKLMEFPAVLIEDFKRITGIITRSDALDLSK
jgi:predicted transcriptional regulator/pSer/pThr/pTyr-binding forkhead associated (FHA) protein